MQKSNLLTFIAVFLAVQIISTNYLQAADLANESEIDNYQITANKIDKSRHNLSTDIGASSYSFDQKAIDNNALGDATSINKLLLQAPGVAQDSVGQIHIRGDHSNLQYRINGVIIPGSIAGFGQTFDTHFINNMSLLTGALPAQYGYRTAGVVDITTKKGSFENGGKSEVTVGSNNNISGNQEFSGSSGKFNYYLSGSYLQNDLGIESPTSSKNQIHNFTRQDKQFGYFSYLTSDTSRLSVVLGNATNRFQIPNNPNQPAKYDVNGSPASSFASANLDENQKKSSQYGIVSLQGTLENNVDYQIALFSRFSNMKFNPDYSGDLAFNGVASKIDNHSATNGLQADFNYPLNQNHILRSGVFVSDENVKSDRNTTVFPVDASQNPTGIQFDVADVGNQNTKLYGLYLQDEWKVIDKLTINYGARFDQIQSYINAHQLSPRLGAVYDLSKDTKFHLGYSKYFTPPPSELISSTKLAEFAGTSNAAENLTNDKVRPERIDYYDLGVNHKLTDNINIGLDGYYKNVRDLLDEGQFGTALIYTPFNYQKAKIYGLEFSADYRKDNFSSYLNFAWSEGKAKNIVSGQYLFDADELNYIANNYVKPDHNQTYTASAGAAYKWHQTNYSIDAIYGNGMRKGFANTSRMPSYAQVNLGVNRDFILPIINKFNTRLSVINLFDEVYQIRDGSGIGVQASQYGARRGYYLTISKSF